MSLYKYVPTTIYISLTNICPNNNVPITYKYIPSKCNHHAQCKNAVPIVNEQVQSYNKAGK